MGLKYAGRFKLARGIRVSHRSCDNNPINPTEFLHRRLDLSRVLVRPLARRNDVAEIYL